MTAYPSRFTLRAAAAFCLAASLPATAALAADATGVWINDTGRGAVEIKPCGGALCGHVVWVKDGGDAKGCGRQIIGNAQPAGSGTWDSGWIYSPERKKRYDVELKPLDENRLRVTGYAGSKFFSKTMIWKRAPADLERCGATLAKAETPAKPETAPVSETQSETATAPANAAADAAPVSDTSAKVAAASAKPSSEPAASSASSSRLSPEARLRAELNKEADDAKAAAAKAAEPQVAEAEDTETETASGPDLGGLKLDKYLKRTDGKCQLDLPWVKVDFKCPE